MATRNQQIDKLMKKAPECVCDVNLLIEILSALENLKEEKSTK